MPGYQSFTPGNSTSIAVTASTGRVALPAGTGQALMLQNDSTKTLYFKLGSSTVTAATTDTPILGGAIFVIGIDLVSTNIAAIAGGSDSGTLRITRGEGA